MKLQILVPQYKETDSVIKPLLDSIMVQKNINYDDIGVIITNDGTDVKLTKKFLNSYPFKIEYLTNKHAGVSATRNYCLDHATADYVMFCDADDMFLNVLAIQLILETIHDYPFEVLTSAFTEEVVYENGTRGYSKWENDIIFVHGKVFNREFLVKNNIRWCDELTVHEDSYFNCLAISVAQNKRYCTNPFYLWCSNPNSVSRRDPNYVIKTYHHLVKSAYKLSEDLLKYNCEKDSRTMFCLNLFQTFYIMTGKYSLMTEFKPLIDDMKKSVKEFYNRFSYLLSSMTDQEILEIRQKARKAAIEHGWYAETVTFKDWLNSL